MKRLSSLILLVCLACSPIHSQVLNIINYSHDQRVWVGMNDTEHSLTFGKGTGTPNNGRWRIDHDYNGLNFCKPWPMINAGNYFLNINDTTGWVGIGTPNPQAKLHVNGGIYYKTFCLQYSDSNLKKNILPLKSNLSNLLSVTPITYNLKHKVQTEEELLNGMKKEDLSEVKYQTLLATIERQKEEAARDNTTHYGFIAQELRKIYPELVFEDSEGYLSVNYIGMIPVLVNAIKELNAKNEELVAEVSALKGGETLRNTINDITTSAVLYQNNPNPFDTQTEIKYYIPAVAVNATLCVYDLTGSQILKLDIAGRESGSITINANQLRAGMYLYTLLVDGKEVDTKKMILTGE